MNLPRLVVPVVVALLAMPPATAFAEDQELKVRTLPADTLAITIDASVDFGTLEVGQTGHVDVDVGILNTTAAGWVVTVTGADLTATATASAIDKANLVITGGDTDPWGDPGAVEAFSGSPGSTGSPFTIVQGTAAATGELTLDSPRTHIALTIPAGTEPFHQYRTVLVYTITAAPSGE